MNDRTYRLRVNLIKKLRKKCGKSWSKIAKECGVHVGTINRWKAGGEVRMDNIGSLANALGTTADKIILPDGEEDLTDYVEAEMTLKGNLSDLKQPADITAILKEVQELIGSEYRVMLMYVGAGSIKIGIKLHVNDALRMIAFFMMGRLSNLGVTSVSIITPLEYTDDSQSSVIILLSSLDSPHERDNKLSTRFYKGITVINNLLTWNRMVRLIIILTATIIASLIIEAILYLARLWYNI